MGNQLNGRVINTASDAGLLGNVGQKTTARARPRSPRWRSSSTARCAATASPRMRSRRSRCTAPHGRGDAVDRRPHGRRGQGRRVPDVWGPQNGAAGHLARERRRGRRARREVFPRRRRHRVPAGAGTRSARSASRRPGIPKLGPALKTELAKGHHRESLADVAGAGLLSETVTGEPERLRAPGFDRTMYPYKHVLFVCHCQHVA